MSEKEELRGFLPQAQDDLSEPVDPGSEQNSEPADLSVPTLSVRAVMAPNLSLADFQNAVPLIRDLAVVSTLAEDTGQLEVSRSLCMTTSQGSTRRSSKCSDKTFS